MKASARSDFVRKVLILHTAAGFLTKSAFQLCTLRRWANPSDEGSCQVQRRRRRVINLQQPLRIWLAGYGREVEAIHSIAPIRRQLTPSRVSIAELRGLANCPAIRPTLTIGTCAA